MLFEIIIVIICIISYMIIYSKCTICRIRYYYIGMKYHLHDVMYAKYNKIDLSSKLNKVAIVTGGSRGIGAEVVKQLLQCDIEVIIACRTLNVGEKLIHDIRNSGIISGRAKVYKLDNTSLQSVREFAKQIKTHYDKIDILINNAGIMFVPLKKTEDGYEEQWQVNYLSHFLLTSLLLPLLKNAGRPGEHSRIINVTSCAHYIGIIDFDDIINDFKKTCVHAPYAQSKLAQVMSTIKLQKLLKDKSLNISVYAVHPGIVQTDIFKNTLLYKYKWLMSTSKTIDQGAIPIIYAAVSKNVEEKGGIYISNCKEMAVSPLALDKKQQDRLFELSLEKVHLKDFFQYL